MKRETAFEKDLDLGTSTKRGLKRMGEDRELQNRRSYVLNHEGERRRTSLRPHRTMRTERYPLSPPGLEELAKVLEAPLAANYEHIAVSVVECPDLRAAPFNLATTGLSGNEKISDVGGQPNLFPSPRLDTRC